MRLSRQRRTRLLVALSAVHLLVVPGTALAGDGGEPAAAFGYCDAQVLAGVWSTDVDEAKARIERKVANGHADLVREVLFHQLGQAFASGSVCHAMTSPHYGYADVAALAALWETSEQDALVRMSNKIAYRDFATLDDELRRAGGPEQAPDQAAVDYDAWMDSQFQTCDAEALAEVWGVDTGEAKGRIGHKVAQGLGDVLREALEPLHERARANGSFCFVTTYLSDADVEALAREEWGISVKEARHRADVEMSKGRQARGELQRVASQYRPDPPSAPLDPFGF